MRRLLIVVVPTVVTSSTSTFGQENAVPVLVGLGMVADVPVAVLSRLKTMPDSALERVGPVLVAIDTRTTAAAIGYSQGRSQQRVWPESGLLSACLSASVYHADNGFDSIGCAPVTISRATAPLHRLDLHLTRT